MESSEIFFDFFLILQRIPWKTPLSEGEVSVLLLDFLKKNDDALI